MSNLDERLSQLFTIISSDEGHLPEDEELMQSYLTTAKQAFADAGYVTPENAAKVQEMVNQMVNLANDMARVPTIQYVHVNKAQTRLNHLMTGKEFLERYQREVKAGIKDAHFDRNNKESVFTVCDKAARKAAGLE